MHASERRGNLISFLTCCNNTQHTERQQKLDHCERFLLSFLSSFPFLILKFIVDRQNILSRRCSTLNQTPLRRGTSFRSEVNSHGQLLWCLCDCFLQTITHNKKILRGSSAQVNEIKVKFKCLGNFTMPRFYIRSPLHRLPLRSRLFRDGKKQNGKNTQHNTRRIFFSSFFFLAFRLRLCDHI